MGLIAIYEEIAAASRVQQWNDFDLRVVPYSPMLEPALCVYPADDRFNKCHGTYLLQML